MGVWIEITCALLDAVRETSLPVWECGLKYLLESIIWRMIMVTPCMGVWIEIECTNYFKKVEVVTPCMGVWIEI